MSLPYSLDQVSLWQREPIDSDDVPRGWVQDQIAEEPESLVSLVAAHIAELVLHLSGYQRQVHEEACGDRVVGQGLGLDEDKHMVLGDK